MNEIIIRGCTYGPKNPAICVPVTEKNITDFENKAIEYAKAGVDAIELRADYLGEAVLKDSKAVSELVLRIREAVKDTLLLFTIRTRPEGGTVDFAEEDILNLYSQLLDTKAVDMFDLEYSQLKNIKDIIGLVKEKGAIAVASHHNFNMTYYPNIIFEVFSLMKDAGADVCKIALMPESEADVDTLISVSGEFASSNPDTAIIAISMGELGEKSRIACEQTGSMLTFAAIEKTSAPGQISFEKMKGLLLK